MFPYSLPAALPLVRWILLLSLLLPLPLHYSPKFFRVFLDLKRNTALLRVQQLLRDKLGEKKHHSYTGVTFSRIFLKSSFVTNTKRNAPSLLFGVFLKKYTNSVSQYTKLQPESKKKYLEILLLFVN